MGALENRGREEWGGGKGGGGTGGIRERKEWVMGVLKKWEFLSHASLFKIFFFHFSCASIPFFPN